jgi:hypothetical protein
MWSFLERLLRRPPRKIIIQNLNASPFGLQIEPWAMYEKIAPNSRAELLLYESDGPLEFTLTEEGDAFVGVMADITFSIDGRVIFDSRKPGSYNPVRGEGLQR